MDINKKLDVFEFYHIDYVWLIPFDEDFGRGDLTAGISISLSFGSASQ